MRILELDDVIALLRDEVERAGGQVAWSKRTGTDRSMINRVLNGYRLPTAGMIAALNLRVVFTPRDKSPEAKEQVRDPAAGYATLIGQSASAARQRRRSR